MHKGWWDFIAQGVLILPAGEKGLTGDDATMQMSRLPLGNLSWPDLSLRPSLPTGHTFPVKKGMK